MSQISRIPSSQKVLPIAQIVTGIGILTFWGLFFTVGMAPATPAACYFAYEHSFPPPDLILAAALIASGTNSAQNGGFAGPLIEPLQAAGISLWCIGLGLAIVVLRGGRRLREGAMAP